MDELWQRYRTFWTPVLIGLGIFLVGIIAVHIMTDDPDDAKATLKREKNKLTSKKQPSNKKIKDLKLRGDALKDRVAAWSQRLDQTSGAEGDVISLAVDQALRAAILRGASVDEARSDASLAARYFDGDDVAAAKARRRFENMRQERIDLLRTADPNVGFSRLLIDVYNEMRARANRQDVDIKADRFGFASVTSVNRASLPQRLLNLALVARIVSAAIENGVESIQQIQVDRAAPGRPDAFLHEWGVRVLMVGDMAACKRVLDLLTDPSAPVAMANTRLSIPKNTSPLTGLVELDVKAYSVVVNADASLNLESEEEE